MKTLVTAIILSSLTAPLSAQWLNHPTPGIPRSVDGRPTLAAPAPRTPEGKPDLSGLWNKLSPTYSANIAADLKPGEVQPWAEALSQARRENLGKESMGVLCLPLGPAYRTSAGMTKIIQTPALIVMLNEDLTYRQIFLDGRALEMDPNPTWMGYSVGHWEGDTLVVESAGFNGRSWLDSYGHPHTEALRMRERYQRRDFGHLELDVTLADPTAYARPWTVAIKAELAVDTELLEAVCNENNKLDHLVGKASDDRKTQVKVAPEILAKYVGTYKEQPKLWRTVPRIVEITFSGDTLFGDLDGRGKVPLIAQSNTLFSGFNGLGLEFVKEGQGVQRNLLVKHVSGDYRFERLK